MNNATTTTTTTTITTTTTTITTTTIFLSIDPVVHVWFPLSGPAELVLGAYREAYGEDNRGQFFTKVSLEQGCAKYHIIMVSFWC